MRVPTHPGYVLRDEYLTQMELSAGVLARLLGVSRSRICRLADGRGALTPELALRLARYFNTIPEFWLHLQMAYDLAKAKNLWDAEIEASVSQRLMAPLHST